MIFSKTELELLSEIGKGNRSITDLAEALQISLSQIYRISEKLHQKGILDCSKGVLHEEKKTHVSALIRLLTKARNLAEPLSGTGLQIYTAMSNSKTVAEVAEETKLHTTTILKKIRQGRKMSLLFKEKKMYRINEKIWPDAKECFREIQKYEESFDERVPVASTIYFKNEQEILFSTRDHVDAEKTAFSTYEQYGLGLLLVKKYYVLPKRHLSKREIFIHSLLVAEKEPETRYLIMLALFYLKYRRKLSGIQHPILDSLLKVLSGETIREYPTLKEIQDRTEVYTL